MGIIRPFEEESFEIKDFRRMLSSCYRRKDGDEFHDQPAGKIEEAEEEDDDREKLVCVTSGVSFVGLAIVNRLLLRGYSVRVLVTNEEEMEKLREIEGNMDNSNTNGTGMLTAVTANINEVESLSEAFNGCRGLFHTAAFVDPAGLSGYSKAMADVELKTCENVMEACARTSTMRSCVLTSSLLACIWREDSGCDDLSSTIVNHHCWSDESVCLNRKLWYALGKLRAEKCAWRIAEERGVRLVTICAGLITGPEFSHRNPTSTFAYLKGVQDMYAKGLLATVDVHQLADAHLLLFEAMDKAESFGRYICFDNVVQSQTEADHFAQQLGLHATSITGNNIMSCSPRFELSKVKLSKLMMRRLRCNNNDLI